MSYWLEVPEALAARLDELPISARGRTFDRAINAALDNLGWPGGLRGSLPIGASHWYVNIWTARGSDRELRGHVGPIHDIEAARRVARSWRQTGALALHGRKALGVPLTNNYLSAG